MGVSGWEPDQKNEFASRFRQLDGVERVQSAGGSTSFYIYFDPERVSEDELGERARELARSVGVLDEAQSVDEHDLPSNMLSAFGEPDTVSTAAPSIASDPIQSSAWTGIQSVQERIIAFKQLAPVALAAVDCLLVELQAAGHNGGPPLDERKEAIEALRQLHDCLGALLAAVESEGFSWADGEGLVASCAHYAIRAYETLRDDPIPFAASGLVLAICAALGFPEVGGMLSGAALAIRKNVPS